MDAVILAAAFTAAAALALGVGALVLRGNPLDRRLGMPAKAPVAADLRDRLQTDEGGGGELRRRLVAAGFAAASAMTAFRTIRISATLVLGLGALGGFTLLGPDLSPPQRLMMAMGAAAVGWLWPPLQLDRLAERRRQAMREGFPDSLDLMQVCVEAGLGLDAAIAQVGEEIGAAHPLLGEQYRMMGQELRAGRSRDDALRSLAERMGLDEAKALATLLIQSEALGCSMADALRAYAEDMRNRRMTSAEEKAQQLGVKLSMPLVAFILPALIVVILTPAAQKLSRLFWPLMHRSM
jgi:tight adherence protein C